MINEESKTPSARRTEEGSQLLHDSYSTGGMESIGGTVRGIGLGTGRTDWEGDDSTIPLLLGGIIEQLLENEKQRLSEVRECVEWYEREDGIVRSRIQKLEQLREVAQKSVKPSLDKSTNLELTEEE